MDDGFEAHLRNLKTALLLLDATGPRGFEGLLATILGKIAGHPFRLAGSGSQHGKDGESYSDDSHITFEGKLYSGAINKNEVLSKLTELIAGDEAPDLWVLGATIEIKTQILGPLRSAATKNGIGLLVLDWVAAAPIPPLAVACALAHEETAEFLAKQVVEPHVAHARSTLSAIRGNETYESAARDLSGQLQQPTLGLPIALDANRHWLRSAFSDRKLARQIFGQPLAPLDQHSLATYERPKLTSSVANAVFGALDTDVIVLSGGEGCGKSWVFAQSWSASNARPLTIVVSAADLQPDIADTDIEWFLIKHLIRQTDGQPTDIAENRWRRRMQRWKARARGSSPNVVVFLDGLNQRPDYSWGRWIDALSYHLSKFGGRLAISVRAGYFNNCIKNNLISSFREIPVAEWSNAELKEIFSSKGIDIDSLSLSVINILRNPRVLAIAFELLDGKHIDNFRELSTERLLFEHIRKSARDGLTTEAPDVFLHRLTSHASEIIGRIKQQRHEDRLIFESADVAGAPKYELSSDLLSVAEGRFFNRLSDDPNLYELTTEGLGLALGLSIISALQKAHRNGKDVSEELDIILEPVAALDKTAEAVFAALLVASVDERCNDQMRSALICAYLRLQNIEEHSYPAFASAVRNSVKAAMEALFKLSTSPIHTEHGDWLIEALREQRHNRVSWKVMGEHLDSWLREYSLNPEIGVFESRGEGSKEHERKVAEREALLKQRIESLSPAESDFLAKRMRRNDGGASASLSRQAFTLMAGMPLADFAEALVAWAFSQALNSNFHSPYDEFLFLIRFNNRDWAGTRTALLAHSEMLQREETSHTGRWALVHILRATSTKEDAASAEDLVAELTADRPKFEGWRLVEKYCASDPCDPASISPENIAETATQYRDIDFAKIRAFLATGQEDHFLRDARPGLARFVPEAAIDVHKTLISQIVSSVDDTPKHRLLSLREETALIPKALIGELMDIARRFSRPRVENDQESRDDWIRSQYALLLGLPHMDGSEQLEALMSLPEYGPPLLDLADILKPAEGEALERAFDRCAQSGDANLKMTVLMFARHSDTEISERSRVIIKGLSDDQKSPVRALALDILLQLEDRDFIETFAASGWNANNLDAREAHFERWYGAQIIAEAARHGFLDVNEALNRVSPEHYHFVASSQKEKPLKGIPERLSASITKMLEVELPLQPPSVEQNVSDRRKSFDAPMKSLVDPERELGIEEFFKRIKETDKEFDERQERGWQAYEAFEAALTKGEARLIIEHTGRATAKACVKSTPDAVKGWAKEFIALSDQKLRRIHNFGLIVAEALSVIDEELSSDLFRRLSGTHAYVNIVSGAAAIPLEAICVWGSADSHSIDALRAERLDTAETDQRISQEVLTAYTAGKESFLRNYAVERLARDEPVSIARALMVCGFGLETDYATAAIERHIRVQGLIGDAATAARYAYDRNRWSKHWYEKMCSAASNEEFWRYSVLFLKVVDARYQLWADTCAPTDGPMRSFEPSLWKKIERRIKAWNDKRAKTLFGYKAPGPVFVSES